MSIVKSCESCGEEIEGAGYFGWDGNWYCHIDHAPAGNPPPCSSMMVHAFRLVMHRAALHKRSEINCADLEWAIQELER